MIRTRLTLWNAVVLAAVLNLLGFVVFFSTQASIYDSVNQSLERRSNFLRRNWSNFQRQPREERPKRPSANVIDPAEFKRIEFESYLLHPRIFRIVETKPDDEQPWIESEFEQSIKGVTNRFDMLIEGRRARVISIPLYDNGKISGAAQFAASLENADASVARLARVLLILLPLALLITSITGVWLTRRALRPVAEIADTAGRIEATNLNGRLPVRGADEFASLGTVFNSMLARLESSFRELEELNQSQRRFIADASHELKTPLTAIKTRLGVAGMKEQTPERYAEHLAAIGRSTHAMSAIVGDLLLLAKADEGVLARAKRILPLDSLVDEAVAVASDAWNREFEVDIPEGLTVNGDEGQLARVFINLLDNAARHTPPSGRVSVVASRGDGVHIEIRDEGVGIAPEHLPHLFDRFYRVNVARDRATGGTGLGLPIVKSIIEAHHGSVAVSSVVGQGTVVTLDLPS